jgi:hypothetical protein
MEVEGRRYTPALPLAVESYNTLRLGPYGGLVMVDAYSDQFLSTFNEQAYVGGNAGPAGITTTVAFATTYTGLVLSNPIGSGVYLSLNHVAASFSVVFPAAASIGIMVGYSAVTDVVHTTPLTTGRSAKIGTTTTPKGKLDSSATLPTTPTLARCFGSVLASTVGSYDVDMHSGLMLIPGAYAAIYTSTISGAAALTATLNWDEIRFI